MFSDNIDDHGSHWLNIQQMHAWYQYPVESRDALSMLKWGNSHHCENIHSWISLSGDLTFSHQDGMFGF